MTEAAKELGVTTMPFALIKEQDLPAHQVVPGAPYQIRRSDLQNEAVQTALGRKGAPCRTDVRRDNQSR